MLTLCPRMVQRRQIRNLHALGPYSVPGCGPSSCWYPHNMYRKGTEQYKYHVEHYGPPTEFGYKDFIPMFRQAKNDFSLNPEMVLADSLYDSEKILSFVIDELKAKPRIARNYRWQARRPVRLSSEGSTICIAGFEMIYWGKFRDRGKIRIKFYCPVTRSKKFAKQHPVCPWNHPVFIKGKGCTTYLRGDRNIRKTIQYANRFGTAGFTAAYALYARPICKRFLCYCKSLYYCSYCRPACRSYSSQIRPQG